MQRWSLDVVSDQLADCRRFRVLNIVDDHSRFCPGRIPARLSICRSPVLALRGSLKIWHCASGDQKKLSSIAALTGPARPCSTGPRVRAH